MYLRNCKRSHSARYVEREIAVVSLFLSHITENISTDEALNFNLGCLVSPT